jgi:hypothetical protein
MLFIWIWVLGVKDLVRNKDNEKISIGHLKQNTRFQSNWIEYVTKPLKIKESRVLVKKR